MIVLTGLTNTPLGADAWTEIVDVLPEGIVVQDADGAIVGANVQACTVLGLTADQLLGRTSFDPRWRALRPDGSDFPGDEHPAIVTLRTGQPCDGVVMGVELPTGERRWIKISSRPLTDRAGAGRVVATFSDITAQIASHDALAERELVYRIFTETSRDHVVQVSDDGTIRYQSPAAIEAGGPMVGTKIADALARNVHPHDLARVVDHMARIDREPTGDRSAEMRIRHRDTTYRWYDVRVWRAPGIPGVVFEAHDITAIRAAERRLADAETFFRQAFEDAPIGLCLASIDDVAPPQLVACNRLYAHAFGYEPEDLVGQPTSGQIHADDWAAAQAGRQRLLNGETTRERMQVRIVRRDGSALWCSMTRSMLRDGDGTPRFTMAQLEDATESRAVVDELAALAHSDPLTGVSNRRGLDVALAGLLTDAVASSPAALYFVDLDGFKEVNDRLGHAGGDVVLQTVAQRLLGLTRTGDTVARVGGDEFIVLARHVGSEEAAERLGQRLRDMAVTVDAAAALVVRASVGMARPRAYDSAQALIDRADRMMYRVKQARVVSDAHP